VLAFIGRFSPEVLERMPLKRLSWWYDLLSEHYEQRNEARQRAIEDARTN
jgi:hypothetical protein